MRLLSVMAGAIMALVSLSTSAVAEFQLMMVEQPGCAYCEKWDAEIAPIYMKTPEGQAAPLIRAQLREPLPDGVALTKGRVFYTPTFVLLQDGVERERLEGYPGEDFFWGLLDMMLERANAPMASPSILENG